jgi:broad specificity phosphatase PhoE
LKEVLICYDVIMKIYAIRHGQTKLNVQKIINGGLDDELTEEGIKQAKEAVQTLPKSIKHMYVSSLGRAKQTAAILNANLRLPVTYSDDLREVDFGELNGTPFLKEIQDRHKALDYDWGPSGENLADVLTRTLRVLQEIKQNNDDGEALIVGHGGTIRTLYYLENGTPMGEIENASLFTFDLDTILGRSPTPET